MDTQMKFNIKQNFIKLAGKNDTNYLSLSSGSLTQIYNNQKLYVNSQKTINDISSTDTESLSCQNINLSYEKPNIIENNIILKKQNIFTKELLKAFGENNAVCNFSLFEKNIDIKIDIDKTSLKKLTLSEYFEIFNEAGFLCLNIPFLDKKGNVNYNTFNPTLSSIHLILKNKKIKKENINKKYLKDNFNINFLSDDLINVDFNETLPPYHRDIIEEKINTIHKILGQKKILIDNIVKDNSYFSILWTPADTYKIKSSFLSFYNFDFNLIGTLINKVDDYNWFTTFCSDIKYYKDFKKDYLSKINKVENFLKKCNNINDEDNLDSKLFSQDFKRFIYNY
jgi:hypothetical protein